MDRHVGLMLLDRFDDGQAIPQMQAVRVRNNDDAGERRRLCVRWRGRGREGLHKVFSSWVRGQSRLPVIDGMAALLYRVSLGQHYPRFLCSAYSSHFTAAIQLANREES
jgi:hypothetical protein